MTTAHHILLAIGREAKHGYAIMKDARAVSGVELLPGTLYAAIKTLLADGLIEEVDAPRGSGSTDARRRYYRVTKRGREVAAAETERLARVVRMGRVFLKGTR